MPHPIVYSPLVYYHKQKQRLKYIHLNIWLLTVSFYSFLPKALYLLVSLPSFTPTTFTSEDGEQHYCVNINDEKQNTTPSFVIGKAFNLHFSKHTWNWEEPKIIQCLLCYVGNIFNKPSRQPNKSCFWNAWAMQNRYLHHGGELDCLRD